MAEVALLLASVTVVLRLTTWFWDLLKGASYL